MEATVRENICERKSTYIRARRPLQARSDVRLEGEQRKNLQTRSKNIRKGRSLYYLQQSKSQQCKLVYNHRNFITPPFSTASESQLCGAPHVLFTVTIIVTCPSVFYFYEDDQDQVGIERGNRKTGSRRSRAIQRFLIRDTPACRRLLTGE